MRWSRSVESKREANEGYLADLVNLQFNVKPSVRSLCPRTASSMFIGTDTNIEKEMQPLLSSARARAMGIAAPKIPRTPFRQISKAHEYSRYANS